MGKQNHEKNILFLFRNDLRQQEDFCKSLKTLLKDAIPVKGMEGIASICLLFPPTQRKDNNLSSQHTESPPPLFEVAVLQLY